MVETRTGPNRSPRTGDRARYIPLFASLVAIALAAVLPAVAATPKPDLIVRRVSSPPATCIQGQEFEVTDTTKNVGTKRAGKSKTGYYLSTDKTKSNNDVRLPGTRDIPALAPETRSRGTKSVGIPLSTPPADYFVLACADDLKAVGENDESNNCKASKTKISVTLKDLIPPEAPENLGTNQSSPNKDSTPNVTGTAEENSTVKVFGDFGCAGQPLASGQASPSGDFNIVTPVTHNATTVLTANTTDAADHTSDCSSSITYTHDNQAPAPPSNITTTPVSPANDTTFQVKGTAAAGSTVQIFTQGAASCELGIGGGPTDSAADFANPGIEVTVADDSTTQIAVTATDAADNTSSCAGGGEYVEDSQAPSPPNLTGTDPASPSNVNNPKLQGTAEAGSFIEVYTSADCTTGLVASGGESALSGPGIPLNVGPNTTTDFRATATDAAGNVSACSSPLTYVEDSTAPATPSGLSTSPVASPTRQNDNNPEVSGTSDAGSTVTIHSVGFPGAPCVNPIGTGSAAQFASPGITVPIAENSSVWVRAIATDAAGNSSGCSSPINYLEASPQTEVEPNDGTATASRFLGITGGIQGTVDSAQTDLYQVTVPPGGFVRAETKDQGFSTCGSAGTILTLLDPTGAPLVVDDDDGTGECSLIDGTPNGGPDAAARSLSAGTYFLKVEREAGIGPVPYELRKHVGTTNAVAEVEPNGTVADTDTSTTANPNLLITGNKTIEGSISSIADRDIYKLDLSSPQVVHLETFNATGVDCQAPAATTLLLFDATGNPITLDTSVAGAGVQFCSAR